MQRQKCNRIRSSVQLQLRNNVLAYSVLLPLSKPRIKLGHLHLKTRVHLLKDNEQIRRPNHEATRIRRHNETTHSLHNEPAHNNLQDKTHHSHQHKLVKMPYFNNNDSRYCVACTL
jgi:hypothetical protein